MTTGLTRVPGLTTANREDAMEAYLKSTVDHSRRRERGERRPSATVFVSKVVFVAIAVVLALAVLADALRGVTVPLGVVFGTGLIVISLVVSALVEADRRRAARRKADAATPLTVESRRTHALRAYGARPRGFPDSRYNEYHHRVMSGAARHSSRPRGKLARGKLARRSLARGAPSTVG